MPGPLKRPLVRRLMALGIAAALVLDMSIFALVGYAHVTRTHVLVKVTSEHEIMQVFVNCRLAYYYRSELPVDRTIDLGFLEKEDVLTFQIRGQKHSGFLQLSYLHDDAPASIYRYGTAVHPLLLGAGRVAAAESWTVGGRRLGIEGCQADAPHPLAFATPDAGPWKHNTSLPLAFATSIGKIIPWILAILGATVVAVGAIADRIAGKGSNLGVVARGLLALTGVAVAVVWAVAVQNFSVAFGLCVGTGAASLLAAVVWLLADDICRLVARWAHIPQAP